jgi:hypothetical protein
MCLIPSRLNACDQDAAVNWTPLSVVTAAGMPYRQNQPAVRVARQSSAVVRCNEYASAHLVVLSTAVRMNEEPSAAAGSGPTRSTWMWKWMCTR